MADTATYDLSNADDWSALSFRPDALGAVAQGGVVNISPEQLEKLVVDAARHPSYLLSVIAAADSPEGGLPALQFADSAVREKVTALLREHQMEPKWLGGPEALGNVLADARRSQYEARPQGGPAEGRILMHSPASRTTLTERQYENLDASGTLASDWRPRQITLPTRQRHIAGRGYGV